MKKLMVAVAGAVALGLSAFAESTHNWFDGGISTGWPTAGADLKGGSWTNTEDQAEYVESGSYLEVEADSTTPLTFWANPTNTVGSADVYSVTTESTVDFTPFTTLPAVPDDAKAGVIVCSNDQNTALCFWVLGYDEEGATNMWVALDSNDDPTYTADTSYKIKVTIGKKGDLLDVIYGIGDDFEFSQTVKASDFNVISAAYTGDGKVATLYGDKNVYEIKNLQATTVDYATATISNATQAVTSAPWGSTVKVTYVADEGYVFADGTHVKAYDVVVKSSTLTPDWGSTPPTTVEAEAQIGTVGYLTLEAALAAAKEEETVVLLTDVTVTSKITINEKVTLDPTASCTLSIQDPEDNLKNDGMIMAYTFAALTNVCGVSGAITLAADITLDDNITLADLVELTATDKTITMNGKTITLAGASSKLYYPNSLEANKDVVTNVEGYEVAYNEDDSCYEIVTQGTVFYVTSTGRKFNTLEDAIGGAANTDEIKLLADYEQALDISIAKSIAFDLNGHALEINGAEMTIGASASVKNTGASASAALTCNGAINITAGTFDLSALPWGEGGITTSQDGVLDIKTAGAEVKFCAGATPNWMAANNSNFFASTVSGAKVTVGSDTYTYNDDLELFTKATSVALAEITGKSEAGADMGYVEVYDSLADAVAAVDANCEVALLADVTVDASFALAAAKKIDMNGFQLTFNNFAWTLDQDVEIVNSKSTGGLLNKAQISIAADKTLDCSTLDWGVGGLLSTETPAATTARFTLAAGAELKLGSTIAPSAYPTENFITAAQTAKFNAGGTAYTMYADGWNTAAAAVAQIGTDKYATLAGAAAGAKDDDTIELLGDLTLTAGVTFDKSVTFDLGGYTLTAAFAKPLIFSAGKESVITNGTMAIGETDTNLGYGLRVEGILDVYATISQISKTTPIFDIYSDATVNVYDGAVLTAHSDLFRFKADLEDDPNAKPGRVNIYGGNLTSTNGASNHYEMFCHYKPGMTAYINISGGTLTAPNKLFSTLTSTGGTVTYDITVTGGTLDAPANVILSSGCACNWAAMDNTCTAKFKATDHLVCASGYKAKLVGDWYEIKAIEYATLAINQDANVTAVVVTNAAGTVVTAGQIDIDDATAAVDLSQTTFATGYALDSTSVLSVGPFVTGETYTISVKAQAISHNITYAYTTNGVAVTADELGEALTNNAQTTFTEIAAVTIETNKISLTGYNLKSADPYEWAAGDKTADVTVTIAFELAASPVTPVKPGGTEYKTEDEAKKAADAINNATTPEAKAELIADPVSGISTADKVTYAGYVSAVQSGTTVTLEINDAGETALTNQMTTAVTNINLTAVAAGTATSAKIDNPIAGMWYNMATGSAVGSLTSLEANAQQAKSSDTAIEFSLTKPSTTAGFFRMKAGVKKSDVVSE